MKLFGEFVVELLLQLLVFAQGAVVWIECFGVELIVEVWDMCFRSCGAGIYGELIVDGEVVEFDECVVCGEYVLDVVNGCRIVGVEVVVVECD